MSTIAATTNTVAPSQPASLDFTAFTNRFTAMANQGSFDSLPADYQAFLAGQPSPAQQLLVAGVIHQLEGASAEAVAAFMAADEALADADYPPANGIYTVAFIEAQLALPRSQRPATAPGEANFAANLAALAEVDEPLAAEVRNAIWPRDKVLVRLWGGLYFYAADKTLLLTLFDNVRQALTPAVASRRAIGLGGVITGQELQFCLAHQVDLILGMARPHYVFERDAAQLRALLHLFDFSRFIRSHEVIIFGGTNLEPRAQAVFSTLRYPPPELTVGDLDLIEAVCTKVVRPVLSETPEAAVRAYYASQEYRQRQRQIAAGAAMPRVLIDTCRWTTFLKYCAADFDKAFRELGCPTRYLIEEDDVQSIMPPLHWRELDAFKPDLVFMVSHARPALPHLPRELPFIGFIQDKCGPILEMDNLTEHISQQDLFVCMMTEFQDYLCEKHVPEGQTFVMPIPADERMFYPLDGPASEERFIADVGFVKHGHPHAEVVLAEFVQRWRQEMPDAAWRDHVAELIEKLAAAFDGRSDKRCYEQEMREYVLHRLTPHATEKFHSFVRRMVSQFYITVYSANWRCQFLEALDAAGVELALYGNRWPEHARLGRLSRGPVERGPDLNAVYNHNRINLSINHSTTMHQRLAECGLAGGFMMVADHPQDQDWESARRYFDEGREVVFFDTRADLIEKTRYYLAHAEQRRQIAANMRRRALAERTCRAGAETILARWRAVLAQSLDLPANG